MYVYSVGRRRRTRTGGEPALIVDDDGSATLHVRVGDETNLEIVLERDVAVPTTRGPAVVRRITLYADDPRAYLEEVRRHIGEPRRPPSAEGPRQLKAATPVRAWPITSWCTSEVPS